MTELTELLTELKIKDDTKPIRRRRKPESKNVDLAYLEIPKTEVGLDIIYDKAKLLAQKQQGYELAGTYDYLTSKYRIDVEASHWDAKSDRPYSNVPDNAKTRIVFHTHPFYSLNPLKFPSLEDLIAVVKNPHQIYLLITDKTVYLMSANQKIEYHDIERFFKLMDIYPDLACILPNNTINREYDYARIEKNWLANNFKKVVHYLKLPIYISQIPIDELLLDPFLLDEQIFIAAKQKDDQNEFDEMITECYRDKYNGYMCKQKEISGLKDRSSK